MTVSYDNLEQFALKVTLVRSTRRNFYHVLFYIIMSGSPIWRPVLHEFHLSVGPSSRPRKGLETDVLLIRCWVLRPKE